MSKTFSVIIPSFNRAHLLPFTLDSILEQTLQPGEIIVVDDGSTDNTAEVLARYGTRVKLIRIDNIGVAGARHVGVLGSSGELVAFCDSDDLWLPDHLALLAAVLDNQKVQFAFSNFWFVQNDVWSEMDLFSTAPVGYWQFARVVDAHGSAISAVPIYPYLLHKFQPVYPSCTAMTREFYDQVGGYQREFGALPSEDLEFTLRCVCQTGSVGIVFKPTAGYRRHNSNHGASLGKRTVVKAARQLWGETAILIHSRHHHPVNPDWLNELDEAISDRSLRGFDAAFAAADIRLSREFARTVSRKDRSIKFSVKKSIASLPEFLAVRLSHRLAGPRDEKRLD